MNDVSVTVRRDQLTVTGTEARDLAGDAADSQVDLEALCRLAADVLEAEGVSRGRLDLHLIDPGPMAELNRQHLGHEGSTDVLSFPLDAVTGDASPPDISSPGEPDGDLAGPADREAEPGAGVPDVVLLGDVVLCPAVAQGQAADHVGSFDGELLLLTIHGVLHVLGHDHAEPDEAHRMQERERHHLSPLGFDHPVPA